MWKEFLAEILANHRGKLLGIIIGLIFSLMVIGLGFFQTVFIASCIYIGYIIGKRIDDQDNLRDIIDYFFKEK